jgi:Protein of unknown function (DUF3307)
MLETIVALLAAHALADFIFQTKWMAENKRDLGPLILHTGIVFSLSLLALGGNLWPAVFIALIHLQIDFVKARIGNQSLAHFLTDQAAHGVSILITAALWPLAFDTGLWPGIHAGIAPALTLLAGLILATRMGQFLVGKLMAPFAGDIHEEDGLPNGGALIGLMERGLTFIFVLAGQATAVGLLIAAKSFLRVGTANESRKMAEYVIIGTLASIGWALVVAYGTQSLLQAIRNA